MNEYYNFTASEFEISYSPYYYEKRESIISSVAGAVILITAIILLISKTSKIGFLAGTLIGIAVLVNGLYRHKILNRTILSFDKTTNALYSITPLGKKIIQSLDCISNIIISQKHSNYRYSIVYTKRKRSKNFEITSIITTGSQSNPEVRFLEMEIIPKLQLFLNLNTDINFSTEECSPI